MIALCLAKGKLSSPVRGPKPSTTTATWLPRLKVTCKILRLLFNKVTLIGWDFIVNEVMINKLKSPLLTIMIPVYNGSPYLKSLLTLFENFFKAEGRYLIQDGLVEVRVINNRSADGTKEVAESFLPRFIGLIVHNETDHKPTAEENIFRSFEHCLGTYTWVHGVDDIPIFENFTRAISLLQKGQYDFILFNTTTTNEKHQRVCPNAFEMNQELKEESLVLLAQKLGIWYVLAGISSQIVRTEYIKKYDLATLKKETSPIYAHTIAYLEVYGSLKSCAVNYPLVVYKVIYRDISRWRKTADILGFFDEFFWTLGTVRQMKYLEEKGLVGSDFFGNWLDRNEYMIFRPVSVILTKVFDQLKTMAISRDSRNQVKENEFDEIAEYLEAKDPLCREIVWKGKEFFLRIVQGQKITKTEWTQVQMDLGNYAENFMFNGFFKEKIAGYEIYRIAGTYFAIHASCRSLLLIYLKSLTPIDSPPILLVSTSREELDRKIREIDYMDLSQDIQLKMKAVNDRLERGEPVEAILSAVGTLVASKEKMQKKLENSYAKNQEILRSMSWKVTAPLRIAGRAFRRLIDLVR